MKPSLIPRRHFTACCGKENTARVRVWISAVIGLAMLLLAGESFADRINGQVVEVFSGDVFTVQIGDGTIFKVRLMEVDAPEPSQAFGRQARLFTEDLLKGETVRVEFDTVDKYKRLIALVIFSDGRMLNRELLRYGMAWHYRVHYPESEAFRELEYRAWKNKLGLWVDPLAIPPWKYRLEPGFLEPPGNGLRMDYDRILSYGLIGDPKTRRYQWPACLNYPRERKGYILFSNFMAALKSGYRVSPNCKGK
jgi:endonuclease YncB( thermonuclease family)